MLTRRQERPPKVVKRVENKVGPSLSDVACNTPVRPPPIKPPTPMASNRGSQTPKKRVIERPFSGMDK